MALLRENKTLIVKEEVSALYSNIRSFTVDVEAKKISINMEYGNIVSGKFIPVAGQTKTHVIEDLKESSKTKNEILSVIAKQIALSQTPTANLVVNSPSGQLYFEGQDYTRNGTMLYSLTIPDGARVDISYGYAVPATSDFSSVAASNVDGTKSLYGNIKTVLWNKLKELGYEKGVVE